MLRPTKPPTTHKILVKATEYITRTSILRSLLVVAAVALLLAIMPRADHQSFIYELNQPWRYPLLTAEYDTPILRDSASARVMRDSIDAMFIPFADRDQAMGRKMADRFSRMAAPLGDRQEVAALHRLILQAYDRGIMTPKIAAMVKRVSPHRLRISENEQDNLSVVTVDASAMFTATEAFKWIDSVYVTDSGKKGHSARLSQRMADAVGTSLIPNVDLDSAADMKFRSQEYLDVEAALGVIKKGQRIVDRGEIITPQVFTNLNTYQEVLRKNNASVDTNFVFILGQGLYLITVFGILYLYLFLYRPKLFGSLRYMTFLVSFVSLFAVFTVEMFEHLNNGIYLVPFAVVPVIIAVFCDTRTAVFSLLATVLLTAIVATFPFQFIFMEMVAGMAATFSLHNLSRRSQLLRTACVSFAAYVFCYLVLTMCLEGNLSSLSGRTIGMFAINCVVLSFAYILILVIEKIFGFTSLVTLVELSDISNPLLRKMAEVAPGTFQHSIQVSTLAAEAARAIGANTQLVRAGALYHDIGKSESPVFFTENQHGVNPHAGLAPETSAQKIISHVTDGLAIANKEKLPAVIKSFIAEHHGKGVTKYFYTTALNNARDGETVDITKFQYPGPDPQSKETAILMMADCVEAASRSLKDYSSKSIDTLVDKLIDSILAEGHLKEAPISLKEIEVIRRTFKKRLATIYHTRVAYPEAKKSAPAPAPPQNTQAEGNNA